MSARKSSEQIAQEEEAEKRARSEFSQKLVEIVERDTPVWMATGIGRTQYTELFFERHFENAVRMQYGSPNGNTKSRSNGTSNGNGSFEPVFEGPAIYLGEPEKIKVTESREIDGVVQNTESIVWKRMSETDARGVYVEYARKLKPGIQYSARKMNDWQRIDERLVMFQTDSETDPQEEERNLFGVSLTKGKRRLVVSHPWHNQQIQNMLTNSYLSSFKTRDYGLIVPKVQASNKEGKVYIGFSLTAPDLPLSDEFRLMRNVVDHIMMYHDRLEKRV